MIVYLNCLTPEIFIRLGDNVFDKDFDISNSPQSECYDGSDEIWDNGWNYDRNWFEKFVVKKCVWL